MNLMTLMIVTMILLLHQERKPTSSQREKKLKSDVFMLEECFNGRISRCKTLVTNHQQIYHHYVLSSLSAEAEISVLKNLTVNFK